MRDHFYCEINMKCARSLHFTLLNLPFYQNLMYQHLKNFISQTFLHNWTNLVKLLFCFYFVLMVLENNLFYITISFLLIQKSNKLSQPFHLTNNLSPNYFYLKLFLICLLQLFFAKLSYNFFTINAFYICQQRPQKLKCFLMFSIPKSIYVLGFVLCLICIFVFINIIV